MNEIDREATDPYIEMRDARDNLMAQLAALRDERDRAVRSLGVFLNGAEINEWWLHIYHSADAMSFKADSFAPGDFDYLRQLIESEEG